MNPSSEQRAITHCILAATIQHQATLKLNGRSQILDNIAYCMSYTFQSQCAIGMLEAENQAARYAIKQALNTKVHADTDI